jgi:GNAT superfamily N-acetyltransferase
MNKIKLIEFGRATPAPCRANFPALLTERLILRRFLITHGDKLAGSVTLEKRTDLNCAWIRTLRIRRSMRDKLIGTRALQLCEDLSRAWDCTKLVLKPEPLVTEELKPPLRTRLLAWYRRNGYTDSEFGWGQLEKTLTISV